MIDSKITIAGDWHSNTAWALKGHVVIEIEAPAHLLDVYTNGAIYPRFLDEWTFDSWALVPERFNLPGPLSAIHFNAPVQMALAITVTEYPAL